jgi:alpha-L-fucosidase
MDRLNKLGTWLDVNGEGLFETRPWVRAQGPEGKPEVRFTQKAGSLFAFLLEPPTERSFTVSGIKPPEGAEVRVLGQAKPAKWRQDGPDLRLITDDPLPGVYAVGVRIHPAPSS